MTNFKLMMEKVKVFIKINMTIKLSYSQIIIIIIIQKFFNKQKRINKIKGQIKLIILLTIIMSNKIFIMNSKYIIKKLAVIKTNKKTIKPFKLLNKTSLSNYNHNCYNYQRIFNKFTIKN